MENTYLEIIEKQISEKKPICTFDTYQKLIKNECLEEEEVRALLASMLEVTIRGMLAANSEFDEEMWEENLNRMSNRVIEDVKGERISAYQLEKSMARIRKEYGYIPQNGEDKYMFELSTIEATLYSYYVVYGITSDEAKKIVMTVSNWLNGCVHNKTLNFFTELDKKIFVLSDLLEEKCNPYRSEYVHSIVRGQVDLSTHENDRTVFTPILKSLERVYRSIIFWDKQYGRNGYFTFLEQLEEELCIGDPNSVFTTETFNESKK